MCEPMTIMAISAVAAAAGAGMSAQSQRNQYKFQEGMARNNATVAEYARLDAMQRGGEAANKASREAQRLRGSQVVRMAANGLDINSGTPAAMLDDTDYFGQQDAQTIRNNAARQAWGYEVEKGNLLASASMYKGAAKQSDPALAAGLSLLGSAGQFASAGAFGPVGKTPKTPVQ